MMRIIGIATSALLLSATAAAAEDGNKYNPNVVNSPGPTGVGRQDPSPSSPAVSGYTRDGKTTSTITGSQFGDSPGPSAPSGNATTAR
jgi:hypothetical protein